MAFSFALVLQAVPPDDFGAAGFSVVLSALCGAGDPGGDRGTRWLRENMGRPGGGVCRVGGLARRTMQRWCGLFVEQASRWLGAVQATLAQQDSRSPWLDPHGETLLGAGEHFLVVFFGNHPLSRSGISRVVAWWGATGRSKGSNPGSEG